MKEILMNIPKNCILGLNYSGMHDTSISIVNERGKVLYATSLERVTRIKQDGRFPKILLDEIPWQKIKKVAISNSEKYLMTNDDSNISHPIQLKDKIIGDRGHKQEYYKKIDSVNCEKVFFPHHLCHASSSFYGSGFDDAICLVYDGGMSNEHWFGGIYIASKKSKIKSIELFSAQSYFNITKLYSIITAILGFTPIKHEGKITGLAALGNYDEKCQNILNSWISNPKRLNGVIYWKNMYSDDVSPSIGLDYLKLDKLKEELKDISDENIAYNLQDITEKHILKIIENFKLLGLKSKNICLSGGLFANVKLNQKISNLGFDGIYITPAMGDDGTSLGAAWLALDNHEESYLSNVYLGDSNSKDDIVKYLDTKLIKYKELNEVESTRFIAKLLSEDKIVSIFQGNSEFGPRALGNRSILAQATKSDINNSLNDRLSRTEFMPFAPIIRDKDFKNYFNIKEGELNACRFMTLTVDCKKIASLKTPAIVHVDNTARPQILKEFDNSFVYEILSYYDEITGNSLLVNTSFNVHEEPIVNTFEDALKGFFESGLDYLYLDGLIISLDENLTIYNDYLKKKLKNKEAILKSKLKELDEQSFYYQENQKEREVLKRGLEESQKEREVLKRGLEESQKEREVLKRGLEESQKEREVLKRGLEESQKERDILKRGLEESQKEREVLKRGLEESQKERDILKKRCEGISISYNDILNSKSWKITKPLREFKKFFKNESIKNNIAAKEVAHKKTIDIVLKEIKEEIDNAKQSN